MNANTMKSNASETTFVSPRLLMTAAAVILIGIVMFCIGRAQHADPTLTQAPPAAPGAQPLTVSPEKAAHPGPLYTLNGTSAVPTPASGGPVSAGGYPAPTNGSPQ